MESIDCPKCGQRKGIDEFNRNAARHNGLDSWCRACMRAAERTRSLARKAQPVPAERQCAVDGCEDRRKGHGYCNRHLKRFQQYGDPLAGRTYKRTTAAAKRPDNLSLEESFRWFMPGDPPPAGKLWLWRGPVDEKGYGTIRFQGRNVFAHRISYELFVGPIPDGCIIRHKNDTPLDVNPANLEPGSLIDNVRDREERGRTYRGRRSEAMRARAARGTGHALAKVAEADIPAIREAHAGGESQQSIADRYGISQFAVSCIVRRKTWAHVP